MSEKIIIPRRTLISLAEGDPTVGVSYILPAWQIVHLNAPANEWAFRRLENNKYHLSVSGYGYTGVEGNRVIGSIHPEHDKEWTVTFVPYENGFTVELADRPGNGWKVEDGQLVIAPIIVGPSEPAYYPPNVLFRFRGLVKGEAEKAIQGAN